MKVARAVLLKLDTAYRRFHTLLDLVAAAGLQLAFEESEAEESEMSYGATDTCKENKLTVSFDLHDDPDLENPETWDIHANLSLWDDIDAEIGLVVSWNMNESTWEASVTMAAEDEKDRPAWLQKLLAALGLNPGSLSRPFSMQELPGVVSKCVSTHLQAARPQ